MVREADTFEVERYSARHIEISNWNDTELSPPRNHYGAEREMSNKRSLSFLLNAKDTDYAREPYELVPSRDAGIVPRMCTVPRPEDKPLQVCCQSHPRLDGDS